MEFLTGKFGQASLSSLGMRLQDYCLVRSLVFWGLGRLVGAMQMGWCLAADQASPKVGNGCKTLPVQKWLHKDWYMWHRGTCGTEDIEQEKYLHRVLGCPLHPAVLGALMGFLQFV